MHGCTRYKANRELKAKDLASAISAVEDKKYDASIHNNFLTKVRFRLRLHAIRSRSGDKH